MNPPGPFSELTDVHVSLNEALALHRDLVVGLEFAKAADALDAFERDLVAHMTTEERHVFPLYAERVGHVLGGDPEFFYAEHRNLRRLLAELKERIRTLAADPRAGRRQAHEFLAAEHLFMQILDHHDRRERNTLYPELDRNLTAAERAELLRRCVGP